MRAHAKASSAGSTTGRGRATIFAIGLLLGALTLAAIAPGAMATIFTRAKIASFGPNGTSATSFGNPTSLAFNQAADRVYVNDGGAQEPKVVHAFNAPALTLSGGAFPLTVGPSGEAPSVIAVDNTLSPSPSAGNIYYIGQSTDTLYGFDSDGTPLGGNFPVSLPVEALPFGGAVDSVGNVYVSNGTGDAIQVIRKYDPAGNFLGTIDTSAKGSPGRLAFDSNDDLFFTVIPLGGGQAGLYKATAASGYSQASITKIPWSGQFSGGEPPGAIAVDGTSHTLYAADVNKVSAFNAITGAFLYDFASGIRTVPFVGAPAFSGLAVDEATDTVYLSDHAGGQDKVHVFSPAQSYGDASATPTAAKNLTDVSAEIGATITDNNALATSWRLELSADNGLNWKPVKTGQTAGGQSGLAVSASLTGLLPGTTYKFRVVTSKGAGAANEVTSSTLSFTTLFVPPVITDVGAIQVADTSVRMVGAIDPRATDTGYVFQYGTTPALGSSTAPLAIGAGTKPITVSQVVGGLSKGTTYYFRLVATNLSGTTTSASRTFHTRTEPFPPADPGNCPNEAVRQQQSSTFLPDCRAYEMVTPSDKNQGSAGGVGGFGGDEVRATFSRDGGAVVFCTGSVFGEPPSQLGFTCAPYLSRRGAGGWSTVNPLPSYCMYDPVEGESGMRMAWFAPQSFDRVAVAMPEFASCATSPLVAGAPLDSSNIYRGDLSADPSSFDDLLSPEPSSQIRAPAFLGGGSADFSHVVYASYDNQTPDSPTPENKNFLKLYDWEEEGNGDCLQPGGCLSLVSVDPSGNPFTTQSKFPGYNVEVASVPIPGYVSDDGERIYFTNTASAETFGYDFCDAAACSLYLREGGTTTIHVGASECTTACGVESSPEAFLWASPNGEKALFGSCAKLTDASAEAKSCTLGETPSSDDNLKLYRWDRNAPEEHRLVDLSIDSEPADGSQPRAVDIIGASSEDLPSGNAAAGNTVYFVAAGQLVSGASTGEDLKLYRWRWNDGSPSLDYLGPYQSSRDDGAANSGSLDSDPNANRRHVRVTADGRYLVVQTKLALDPAGDRDTDSDLYRWSEADGWLCASCQLPGVPSAGPVTSFTSKLLFNTIFFEIGGQVPEHTISDDGQRIFFTTPDALVPEDVNGESGCPAEKISSSFNATVYRCADLYEWHDGTVSLLSSGTGSGAVQFIGASAAGEDVFFAGSQRLVGWDLDNSTDIYDAHVAGGFPEPAAQPPSCEGEACHGAGAIAPASAGAGSAVFEGPGNPAPKHAKARKRHKKRHHKHATKRHQRRAADHNRRAGR